VIDPAELDELASPHIARAWFVRLDLPTGVWRVHSGSGRITAGGEEWAGINDPLGGVLASIGQIEEPRFGSATAITLTLSGVNRNFFRSVHATRREIEGRPADIYWGLFHQETQKLIGGLKPMFIKGRMTSPALQSQGIGVRTVSITVENIWQAQNYAPGGIWNDAGQQARYPGDKGLEFVGVKVTENWA
jgi:hypothetical protein